MKKFRKGNNHSSLSSSEYITYQPLLKHILQVLRTKRATIRTQNKYSQPLSCTLFGEALVKPAESTESIAKPKPTVNANNSS